MIKAVIFDLDGVIVSTDHYHYLAWKKLADNYNIEFNEQINERLRGVSRVESLEIILEKANKTFSIEEKQKMLEYKNALYVDYIKEMTPKDVSDDVIKIINFLKENNYKIAIGSSSKNTKIILNQIGLTNTFDAIIDGNMITKSKPDPEVFQKAGQSVNIDPSECLVVEDAIAGIDAGVSAKMQTLAIGSAKDYHKATFAMEKLVYKNFKEILQGGQK